MNKMLYKMGLFLWPEQHYRFGVLIIDVHMLVLERAVRGDYLS